MSKTGNFEVYYRRLSDHKMVLACVCDTEREAYDFVRYYKKGYPHKFLIVNLITEGKAREFFRDLIGTLNESMERSGLSRRFGNGTQAIISDDYVAEIMGMSKEMATDFLYACARCNLTERQGGAWVI